MSHQGELPYRSLPFVPLSKNPSGTSRDAARSVASESSTLRERCYRFIQSRGSKGATCDEIEVASKRSHQTISARIRELKTEIPSRIFQQGKRPTRTGRNADIHIAHETSK